MNKIGCMFKMLFFGYTFYKNPTTINSQFFLESVDELFIKELKDNTYSTVDDESKDVSTEIEEQKCILCETNKKNIVFIPCSHSLSCVGCSKKIIQHSNCCPICRTTIDNRVFYYS